MMTHRVLVITLAFILAATASAALHAEEPVSTAFTYQGHLKQAGIPVNGAADFRFALWDAATDGVRIGEVVPKDNVTLTDGMFTAEMDFGMSAFTGGARWLEIEIRSPAWDGEGEEPLYAVLTPRQAITAAPLALRALTGGTGDGHSLDALDGDPVDAVIVDADGNVGIGVAEPISRLHIAKPIIGRDYSAEESHIYVRGSDNGYGLAIGALNGPAGAFLQTMLNNEPAPGGTSIPLYLNPGGGRVGIGTTNPDSQVHVAGGSDATTNGGGYLVLGTTTEFNMVLDDNEIMSRINGEPSDLYLNRDGGNVVIGGGSVQTQLRVNAESPSVRVAASNNQVSSLQLYEGANYGFEFQYDGSVDKLHLWSRKFSGNEDIRMTWSKSGNVGIGTTSPTCKLDVAGTTRTEVIQITGADVAEKFPVVDDVKPGMVVAIDPDNPGKLCLARGAYNRCVAGVTSGAGGLPAGAILGNLPGQEEAPPIALSGRVWTNCDADASGAIQPGDLLTTSSTPGHAMRADDSRGFPRGCVIGKAMTKLEAGTGLVLVLIQPQ